VTNRARPRVRVALLAVLWLCIAAYGQESPPLPEGLGGEKSAPPLPAGLEEPSGAPALPEGLGDAAETPPLPPGLEAEPGAARSEEKKAAETRRLPLHGFWDARAGIRLTDDPHEKDLSLGETRLQLETQHAWDKAVLELRADAYLDAVMEKAEFDLREARLSFTPLESVDVRGGRQVLTWGTGDLLFINDLFPKDWQAFFIGRDVEYLKAPSDSLKVGWYNSVLNVEVVYSPQFAPDRYITGERISYYNPLLNRRAGRDLEINTNPPSTWFQDDEFACRLYHNFGAYQLAFYGYSGYWKSPGGQRLVPLQATFPKLSVYGASLRGPVGKGIGNVEVGYYDSRQDPGGDDPFVNNSEFRFLIGYERELAKELTGGFQYYLEHTMDYSAYRNTLPFIIKPRDRDRHVLTARLTKLLLNQDLTLSLFAYASPSDGDAYLRPHAKYKFTDAWTFEAGANWFLGKKDYTFFGQFEDNTNLYAAARYSF